MCVAVLRTDAKQARHESVVNQDNWLIGLMRRSHEVEKRQIYVRTMVVGV